MHGLMQSVFDRRFYTNKQSILPEFRFTYASHSAGLDAVLWVPIWNWIPKILMLNALDIFHGTW